MANIIDLIPEDGACCLPFQTMNDNFLGKEYAPFAYPLSVNFPVFREEPEMSCFSQGLVSA